MDFYQENAIENWTCVALLKYYRLKKKQKDRKRTFDSIKKDLLLVEDSISFSPEKRRKAREILDNWKKWTAPMKNIQQACASIRSLRVKRLNQLATSAGFIYNDNRKAPRKRFGDVEDEGANTKNRNVKNVNYPDEVDESIVSIFIM
ncbi:14325_t:CDS:2 [Acaulospora colombiana]|uniref:14325_t:CDS:1 n=1 Tax=Acaulospora colombiana TaxID=27376 RepID=A0ACA9K7A1_9GLOM|nr:14325_t:CDS:2 [Acaulospora colombiana]